MRKSILLSLSRGASLVETMLVLAVAVMILMLSIRFYQSTVYANQSNYLNSQIQAVSATMESFTQGVGSYASISTSSAAAYINQIVKLPWASASFTIGTVSSTSYTVTISSVPAIVCNNTILKLMGAAHFGATPTCGSGASAGSTATTLTYSYGP